MLIQEKNITDWYHEKERLLQEDERQFQLELELKEIEMQDKTKPVSLPLDPEKLLTLQNV